MSCSVTDPRLAFHATYFDAASHTTKEYLCLFYHGDSTVELIDATHGKTFLKRTACPNLTKSQFFIGANIVVFGRVLTLTRYADKVTEQLSEKTSEATIVVISEPLFPSVGTCLDIVVQECCFSICSMSVTNLRTSDWDGPASFLPRTFAGHRAMVLHLVRDKALIKAADLPSRFGSPKHVWVAASKAEVEDAQALATLADRRPAAEFSDPSSVVIIKPHLLQSKRGGEALQQLLKKLPSLKLANASQLTLSGAQADSFLQPYKGVLQAYKPTVEELASSACWAVQLVAVDPNVESVVDQVRDVVGPFDPVIAKLLRPKTLRAMFGADSAHNALHCSDLPDDGRVDAQFLWGRR